MHLTAERKKQLRALGHSLKPIVTVAGRGLSDSVKDEIARSLRDHELIKVKLAIDDRELRQALCADIAKLFSAEVVQTIGKIILLYCPASKPNKKLSNLTRTR